ncbi:hypothetical protein [Bacterioplanoides sp.]|uniref:hypothetical protein n=1 Tax=Bacterioplanoides sp. TaxID=2066072 RepID=UPI003B5CCA2B
MSNLSSFQNSPGKSLLTLPIFTLPDNSVNRWTSNSIERLKDDLKDLESVPLIIEDVFLADEQRRYSAEQINDRLYPLIEYFLIKFRALHDHLSDIVLGCSRLKHQHRQPLEGSFPTLYAALKNRQNERNRTVNPRSYMDPEAVKLITRIQEKYLNGFNRMRNHIIHDAANVTVTKINQYQILFYLENSVTEDEYQTFPHYVDKTEKNRINFRSMYESEMRHLVTTLNTLYDVVKKHAKLNGAG